MALERQAAVVDTPSAIERDVLTVEGLRHAAANVGLSLFFLVAAVPRGGDYHLSVLTDSIWSAGMLMTGAFCLIRPRPSAVMLDWRAIASGTGAFVLPALMARTKLSSDGFAYHAAIVFEFVGVTISQLGRVYLGQSFAVLPANRGIVSRGPFRLVRHPIYLGWTLLAMGFSMAYPSVWNLVLLAAGMSLMFWRIKLEEELLGADPSYRAYRSRVRWRMVPGVY
jgi:protein-S-isoprenylcysteine O-methyltransferase Ste14